MQWLPAVGPAGENLVGPPADPRLAAWWRGPSVMDAVDAFAPAARNVARPLRLPVAEVGKGARGGTAVSGCVISSGGSIFLAIQRVKFVSFSIRLL